mmetsp:Transcript_56481/g.123776  ORF Transcript_56481/g.123776 Transcript_56481/m.123776 type:complete len:223 (-) Transcript_56481:100-768(-)
MCDHGEVSSRSACSGSSRTASARSGCSQSAFSARSQQSLGHRRAPLGSKSAGSVAGSCSCTPRSEEYGTPVSSGRVTDFEAVYSGGHLPTEVLRYSMQESELGGVLPAGGGTLPELKEVFSAARHGRHKEVAAALEAGFDPTLRDGFGNTLFHVACQNGNKRIAKNAVRFGGDMDAQNHKGHTGLHFLFQFGYAELGEYFISKGALDSLLNCNGHACRDGLG